MGYYTYFSLSIIDADEKTENAILEELNGKYGDNFITTDDSFEAKWYNRDNDLREVSQHYPNAIIELHGDGEGSDDLWKERWRNGVCEHIDLVVDPPFRNIVQEG